MKKISRLRQLKEAGFDLSVATAFKSEWRVACSRCAALFINGVPCHETGCPNRVRKQQGEDA